MEEKIEILNQKEYQLKRGNIFYKFILYITNDSLFIKWLTYEIKLRVGEFSKLIKINLNSLQEEFNYLDSLFTNDCIEIKEVIENDKIILKMKKSQNNQENNAFLYLSFNGLNKDFIINDLYNRNANLEKEFSKIKSNFLNEKIYKQNNKNTLNNNNFSDKLNLKSIKKLRSFTRNPKDNTFYLFKSKDNIIYLIYSSLEKSIIAYDINDDKQIIEIKNVHDDDIIGFNCIFDKRNKRDLMMSISSLNFLKVWDIQNWECLLYLTKINLMGLLHSACFFYDYDKEETYIVTSNSNSGVGTENIKIYNLEGKVNKKINNSNEDTSFVCTYYEEDQSRAYIIMSCKSYIKSYDYKDNKLYHKYYEKSLGFHFNVKIEKSNGLVKLYDVCCSDGFIRIWNFHHGNLLLKINSNLKVCSLCLWNEKYLFSGTIVGQLLLVDILNQKVINIMDGHKNWINCIKKIKNNKNEEYLITQGFDDEIQMWLNDI
jgi:hypothetical protein